MTHDLGDLSARPAMQQPGGTLARSRTLQDLLWGWPSLWAMRALGVLVSGQDCRSYP